MALGGAQAQDKEPARGNLADVDERLKGAGVATISENGAGQCILSLAEFSASCGIEPGRVVADKPRLDGAIERARHKPDACVILQRDQERAELVPGRDNDWGEAMATAAKMT